MVVCATSDNILLTQVPLLIPQSLVKLSHEHVHFTNHSVACAPLHFQTQLFAYSRLIFVLIQSVPVAIMLVVKRRQVVVGLC